LVVESDSTVMELVAGLRGAERPLVVVHHLGDRVGERTLATESGPLSDLAGSALEEGWNRVAQVDGERVMVEVLGASRRLIVCGAGHDAAPLVRHGAELGFEPILVDDRRPFLSTERFPGAAQLVHVNPSELALAVDLAPTDVVVIMSHNYLRDLAYLEAALGRGVTYIGVLGPGERLNRLLDDLAERGVKPDEDDLAALHGPAGLDIGAEGPTEIAWAVLAEIMAVRRHAGGGFLRDRKGPPLLRGYDPDLH
jgi:xanthine/CO dehydrogenase XdhC/CoxF family maturation factor